MEFMIQPAALFLALAVQLNGDVVSDPPTASSVSPARTESVINVSTYDGSARQLQVEAPFTKAPEIDIDGRLDDPAWLTAALLTGFTQFDPVEGSPASENTEVRVIVGEDALYFSIRALDSSGGVRATLTERDGYGRSDTRESLRAFFEVDAAHIVVAVLSGLAAVGEVPEGSVNDAIRRYDIDPESPNPYTYDVPM